MTNVALKNDKIMSFGGIFLAINQFKPIMNEIDTQLGSRCRLSGYQYSEIVQTMMCIFLCGSDRTDDINRERLSLVQMLDALSFLHLNQVSSCLRVVKGLNVRH